MKSIVLLMGELLFAGEAGYIRESLWQRREGGCVVRGEGVYGRRGKGR